MKPETNPGPHRSETERIEAGAKAILASAEYLAAGGLIRKVVPRRQSMTSVTLNDAGSVLSPDELARRDSALQALESDSQRILTEDTILG